MVSIGAGIAGAQFLPPTYVAVGDAPPGSIEVYVSDPEIQAQISVIVFDIDDEYFNLTGNTRRPGQPVANPKILLNFASDIHEVIDWAVIFSGSARFREPGLNDTSSFDGQVLRVWSTRVVGELQVVEGRATVGPEIGTARHAEWFQEAVGPFYFRSGSWPTYGSKSTVVLPAVGTALHHREAGLPPSLSQANLDKYVSLALAPPGRFLRLDGAEPPAMPATEDNIINWHDFEPFADGVKVLYTDVAAEADESSRAVLAGVLLGLAGSGLLSAIGLWFRFLSYVAASRWAW